MMIDRIAIEAARAYLGENGPEGLEAHLKDIGIDANPTKVKAIVREMLKEDGYKEYQILKALEAFED
ncbi:MAG: hypothetical protein ABIG84_00245 [archaeon]